MSGESAEEFPRLGEKDTQAWVKAAATPQHRGGKTAPWRVAILGGNVGQFIMFSCRARIHHQGLSDSDSGPLALNGSAALSGPIGDMLVS